MTSAAPAWGVGRAKADAYFAAWRGRQPRDGAALLAVESMHARLLDATFGQDAPAATRRRLAISTPGVPVVYSHKCAAQARDASFRLLIEPGGPDLTVAEQVAASRDLLHRLTDAVGWQRAGDRAAAVLDNVLPRDSEVLAAWHGGLALGLESSTSGAELRVYCNVRHGDLVSRWQRFADAVGELADQRTEPAFRDLLDRAVPRTIPAGLALSMADGGLRGIRLYSGLLDPSAASALDAAPPAFAASADVVRCVVDSYGELVGVPEPQDIILGYDFAMEGDVLSSAVVRYKLDLSCEVASERDRPRVAAWAEAQATTLGLDASGLRAFFDELDATFGGWTLQYLSLGCRLGGEELTAYCIPGTPAADIEAVPVAALRAAPPNFAHGQPDDHARPHLRKGDVGSALEPIIARAVASLLASSTAPGRWSDFQTLAGPATDWVTAFVGFALATTDRADALAAARAAWQSLSSGRGGADGWGYNAEVPCDADSTVWALRLTSAIGVLPGQRALRFLARHIDADGAVSTYASPGPIRAFTKLAGVSFDGWCGPHACVTAAAAGLRELPERDRVLDWLRQAQRPEGHWESYWWDTPYYATAHAAEVLATSGDAGDVDRVLRAIRWVDADLRGRGDHGSPFEQALALRALVLSDPPQCGRVEAIVDELSRTQRPDGSWRPSARLRIPPPDVADPRRHAHWVEGGSGGGSIQVDAGGRFTTASVLLALQRVAERRSGLL